MRQSAINKAYPLQMPCEFTEFGDLLARNRKTHISNNYPPQLVTCVDVGCWWGTNRIPHILRVVLFTLRIKLNRISNYDLRNVSIRRITRWLMPFAALRLDLRERRHPQVIQLQSDFGKWRGADVVVVFPRPFE